MISPFKAVLDDAYKSVEERLHAAVQLRFGLPPRLPDALRQRIKKADQVAAFWEAVRLAGFAEAEATRYFGRPGRIGLDAIGDLLDPWPASEAESLYLACFEARPPKPLPESLHDRHLRLPAFAARRDGRALRREPHRDAHQ